MTLPGGTVTFSNTMLFLQIVSMQSVYLKVETLRMAVSKPSVIFSQIKKLKKRFQASGLAKSNTILNWMRQ